MKKRIAFFSLLLLLSVVVLTACAEEAADERYVRIMLADTEHVTVTSENPVLVKAGEDAVFQVEVEDQYAITSLSGNAVWENGTVTLKNAEYPTTIKAVSKIPEYYWFEYRYSSKEGSIETSLPAVKHMEGTEVTIKATPAEGAVFLGFSRDAYLNEGGTFLSASSEYTFTLNENITLFANYVSPGNYLLTYHPNGGSIKDSDMDALYVQSSAEHYLCPNTLPNNGQFVRDGYALLGYNTEPDGSGRFYGCTWNVVPGEDKREDLYCVWVPFSPAEDFTHDVIGGKVRITGYRGDDEFVVIPETIDGVPVGRIAKGAFSGCTFKTVYLTKNIEVCLSNAFKDCKNLETLYITDMFSQGSDDAFTGCDNLKTMSIVGVLKPTYSYMEMAVNSAKFEQLLCADPDQKKLTVVSGSSSLYGLFTPQLEEALNGEYNVINYGLHANTPCTFFMQLVAAFTNPGDLVVNAPEPFPEQWGSNTFNMTLWQINECSLDAMSYVNISNFENVFTSFATFNDSRKKMQRGGKSYDLYDPNYDVNGDLILYRPDYGPDYVTMGNGVLDFSRGCHGTDNVERFNASVAMLREKGAECLLSYCPINYNALSEYSRKELYQERYEKDARTKIDSILISELQDYIMNGSNFYNTDMHPNTQGSERRTAQLAKDIQAYLNGETKE